MLGYVLKRLLLMIVILFCVIVLVFFLLNWLPGNPGQLILGMNATPYEVEAFNEMIGVNRPVMVRFTEYIVNIFTRFDFGLSYRGRQPVVNEIMQRLPITATFACFAVLVSFSLGVPLGIAAALRRARVSDSAIVIWAIFLTAVPSFILSLVLVYVFSVWLGWLPVFGLHSWRHYILPVLSLGVPGSAGFIRMSRMLMLDVLNQDYVKTARSKGLPEYKVIWKHAFKNAMLPIVNGTGLAFVGLLGGSVIIEQIFAIPGLGQYILRGVRGRDTPVVMATTIFLAALFCIMVFVIDMLYAYLDPRIKAKFSSKG
jgi:peptide/nickel transport system permease protein